ncbi:MAG: permease [Chloroflexota bacterium]
MEIITQLLQGGWNALLEYLSAHVLTCLIPAFFIAGAIAVFVSRGAVIKYFGPRAKKLLSYSIASISGTILAVCSCTVLPLFGGIYKRGAGIGPAVAFLYSGPAINVLAIVYTARILGFDLGLARAIGAVAFAAGIGLIMALIYRREESLKDSAAFDVLMTDPEGKKWWLQITFFAILVGILIFAASKNWILTGILLVVLGFILWRWFTKREFGFWMKETLRFVRLIVPWLLAGVFAAGVITTFVPQDVVSSWVGGNTLFANFTASFLGALMYFATLTEVPIVSAFTNLGMGKGPTLALLLAGPALSLPNMLVIRNIMGTKKALTYVSLVVVFATITGYIFGLIAQ